MYIYYMCYSHYMGYTCYSVEYGVTCNPFVARGCGATL